MVKTYLIQNKVVRTRVGTIPKKKKKKILENLYSPIVIKVQVNRITDPNICFCILYA